MRISHLTPSSYRAMPWKNGLGVTTEIARRPAHGDFDWRVSVARVTADGSFSKFPGCERVILALDGEGMILRHHDAGSVVELDALVPWSFSGDWSTTCALRAGAFRDFNVITRRDTIAARVSVVVLDAPQSIDLRAPTTLLFCATGSVVAGPAVEIASNETIIVDREQSPIEILAIRPREAQSTLIRVELSPR